VESAPGFVGEFHQFDEMGEGKPLEEVGPRVAIVESLPPPFEIRETVSPVLPEWRVAGGAVVRRLRHGRAIRETVTPESADRRCKGGGTGATRAHPPD